jgi:predicted DNA-binding transcriptional regulator AlpA
MANSRNTAGELEEQSPFMTPQEVARLLQVSVPSVYRYLNDET